ncbi:hypothetical protein [Longimicrobium terrae]|uniref:Lipoprotein n=1 Tax=Longimicrobium terrae TaxID=1639882 RepID=A0A841H4N9_9BACT|nr:hypothetical protein [Longimicrobium terrae]MBB4638699.1 hypothetical protein [Longimicrobium terrae]MBB6072938.1 hypothetical protein [Longimicrobium terrae]NNC31550.1 hypothetical protein [Longimicrobium terrae]
MLSIRGLILLVLAIACASCAPLATVQPRTLEQDERDVLLAVLEDLSNAKEYDSTGKVIGVRRLLILAASVTTPAERYMMPDDRTLREQGIRFPGEVFPDLLRRTRSPLSLATLSADSTRFRLLSIARIDSVRSTPGGINASGERLRQLYPGAASIQFLSRPGFDEQRRHAAVLQSYWCGNLCGGGGLLLLKYRDGQWRVTGWAGMSIS